jgi:hypothetical protein
MEGGGLFIACRAILIPLNEYVDVVDDTVRTEYPCNNIPGVRFEERVYLIADSVAVQDQKGDLRLVEFSPGHFGVATHERTLKVGCPVILLRTRSNGLANGTRVTSPAKRRTLWSLSPLHPFDLQEVCRMPLCYLRAVGCTVLWEVNSLSELDIIA